MPSEAIAILLPIFTPPKIEFDATGNVYTVSVPLITIEPALGLVTTILPEPAMSTSFISVPSYPVTILPFAFTLNA